MPKQFKVNQCALPSPSCRTFSHLCFHLRPRKIESLYRSRFPLFAFVRFSVREAQEALLKLSLLIIKIWLWMRVLRSFAVCILFQFNALLKSKFPLKSHIFSWWFREFVVTSSSLKIFRPSNFTVAVVFVSHDPQPSRSFNLTTRTDRHTHDEIWSLKILSHETDFISLEMELT